MLLKIAWRNIWRNKLRSLVVILATAAGTWSVLLLIAFAGGFIESYINNVISTEIGHIQIHHPEYIDDPKLTHSIKNPDSIVDAILNIPGVEAATYRMKINGMLRSSHGVRGVKILGIIPEQESRVFNYSSMIVAGNNIDSSMRSPLLIGKNLSEDIQVAPGKNVVLTFRDTAGNLMSGAFKISGEFKTSNKAFDNSHVFVLYHNLLEMTGLKNAAQEIVVRCTDDNVVHEVVKKLEGLFPHLRIESYLQIAPEIKLFKTQISASSYIYIFIFMLALIFGIINTMLMAVLERVRELGMLMAIGMNKLQTFLMIVYETIFLAIIGAPIGIFLAYITLYYLGNVGVDLSQWSAGLSEFGIKAIIYPSINPINYWKVALAVFITAVLASIYPAFKAISLRPVEAIHKV